MESVVLTTPITAAPVISYSIRYINLSWEMKVVEVGYTDNLGQANTKRYDGQTATNMIIALNKANLSIKSLHRRVMEQLMTDGVLPAGSITGTPD